MDLRLFPLQTVLFPGMRMPLHIFEDRYKIMVRECIDEDQPFGVVLIRSGEEVGGGAVPHNFGTTARILQVEHLDDGRMNLFTIGEQRFRIIALTTTSPYLRGEVEIIEPPSGQPPCADLMERAQDLFVAYLQAYLSIGNQWTRGVELPADLHEAADYIAARIDVAPQIKQELLEQMSPEQRLHRELEIIAGELPGMRLRMEAHLRQKTLGFAVLN